MDLFCNLPDDEFTMGDRNLGCKWNFDELSRKVLGSSGEHPTFEKFSSNSFRYVVREYIQNSIDAARDKSYSIPVFVRIKYHSIETSDFKSLLGKEL